ncbi:MULTISPECIES: RNA polymerase sigma factor [unclassified Curtobacterium]|uniref:RNA polymerase sigma factor n=1 Tax=unclassified Curtobacterium TaxID=257496 RepID=UPI000D8FA2DE|nr:MULTISPECIES: sigma-70 family RNA polymerase sigma factor [unclassified Curtobacterium]PYY48794.1 sigma-70 family RNA polymerase sigma factor [Curtobacterium sp. MCBD17_023]PZE90061.1 sigma-70 family RNA polymerase sigma factor [Curtobacterium sp. MCBD17_008]
MDDDTEADAALARRLADGDRTALADAFDRFAPTLTRYAWALADSRQDVEELVQDTFLTLWQKAAGLDLATSALLPWLLVVCRNHARNQARRSAKNRGDELPEELAAHPGADEARERLRWVRDEIAALAPIDRRICELCLLEGHSYAEAAQILGLSVGAVTQRVSRSRARLKKAVMHDEH